MLRCISRFDLVGQGRSEASLFAAAAAAGSGEQASPTGIRASLRRGFFSSSRPGKGGHLEAQLSSNAACCPRRSWTSIAC